MLPQVGLCAKRPTAQLARKVAPALVNNPNMRLHILSPPKHLSTMLTRELLPPLMLRAHMRTMVGSRAKAGVTQGAIMLSTAGGPLCERGTRGSGSATIATYVPLKVAHGTEYVLAARAAVRRLVADVDGGHVAHHGAPVVEDEDGARGDARGAVVGPWVSGAIHGGQRRWAAGAKEGRRVP